MTSSFAPGTHARGTLLLADISGYTAFLQGVADAHRALIVDADEPPPAYAVLSKLLDTIVATLSPAYRLVKFEGDAVFAVAQDAVPRGDDVLAGLRACYGAFRDDLGAAGAQWICSCDACARIGALDLKFIVHHGGFVVQPIAGHQELLGPDVNVVHRLLKNHARDALGPGPYALLTDAAIEAMDVPTDGMLPLEEAYDDTPPVAVHVVALA
jgi:class 3 adenylate cyclase